MRSRSLNQWVPLFIWVALIFIGSSIPQLSLGDKFNVPLGADKLAHALEYLILAFLFYRGVREERWDKGPPAWVLAGLACLAIATLDELHQQFIPGRDGSIWDWLADATGVTAGTFIAKARFKPTEREAEQT